MWAFAGVRVWAGVRVCVGVGAPVWVCRGVGVGVVWPFPRGCMYGCVGVWVCGRLGVGVWFFVVKTVCFLSFLIFLSILVCFSLYQQHAAQHNSHCSLHTTIVSLRSRMTTKRIF